MLVDFLLGLPQLRAKRQAGDRMLKERLSWRIQRTRKAWEEGDQGEMETQKMGVRDSSNENRVLQYEEVTPG